MISLRHEDVHFPIFDNLELDVWSLIAMDWLSNPVPGVFMTLGLTKLQLPISSC